MAQGKRRRPGNRPQGVISGRSERGTLVARRPFLLVGLGVALVGALLLAGIGYLYSREVQRQQRLIPAQGTVIEQREQSYGTHRRVVLTVRFTTAAGEMVRFQRTYESGDTTRPAKGDPVNVLYDPAHATHAEIQDGSWVFHALAAAVGVGFLLFGTLLTVRTLRGSSAVGRRD